MKIKAYIGLIYSLFFSLFICCIIKVNLEFVFIIIPFLMAGISVFLKNLFIIFRKPKYINVFHKMYIIAVLLYVVIFSICYSYISIIDHNYGMLFILIPFLLIVLLIARSKLFNKSNAFLLKIIPVLLVGICMIAGLFLLITGMKDTYDISIKTKGYVSTNAYFSEYDVYMQDEEGTTYQLIYQYRVHDNIYSIKTDYGTNYIPELNSIREVRYDTNNPSHAILVGTNSHNLKIFMGAFFTLGSFTFVLAYLYVKGYFDHVKFDIVGTYMAIVCILFGVGIIVVQMGATLSISKTIDSFGFILIIPLLMIIAGSYLLIKNIILSRKS